MTVEKYANHLSCTYADVGFSSMKTTKANLSFLLATFMQEFPSSGLMSSR